MPYCTLTDIKKLIPEVTVIQLTDDEDTGAVVTSRVDEAIAQADAEIDSHCRKKYSVPFSPIPDIVRKWSVDISIYNLYSRRVEELPATRADRYKNTIRQLEGVDKGSTSIGESTESTATSEGGVATNKTASDSVFTPDTLTNY
ncbi:MAG: DUF1320 domain-containing protein [Nitrospirae bacterium]|nr:DUF1320 domain-containing protein [Nitrospirota bacterium]